MVMQERLRGARKACKLTQKQVADVLGVDRSTYTYYEIGKTPPSLDTLVALAALLNVELNWLLGEDRKTGMLSGGEDMFTVYADIAERKLTDLSADERKLVSFYRMLKKTSDEDKLTEALIRVRDGIAEDDKKSE